MSTTQAQGTLTPVKPLVTVAAPVAATDKPFDPMSSAIDAKAENIKSMVGHGVVFAGSFRGTAGMIVHGTIEGDLIVNDDENGKAGTVLITETGVVKGMVCAQRIVICGSADAVVARKYLVIGKSAKIKGHTFFEQMASEAGAEIEGVIRRLRPGSGVDPVAEIITHRHRVAAEQGQTAAGGAGAISALSAGGSLHAVAANG